MSQPTRTDRRQFVKAAALGAAALGAAGPAKAAEEVTAKGRGKTKIRIGTRINQAWMRSDKDNDLRYLKQIGVDYVDIELTMVKGYRESGSFTPEALKELIDRFANVGLKIERANGMGEYLLKAHLNQPEGQKEIDNHKKIGEMLAKAEIPVYGIQCCQATQHLKRGGGGGRSGWDRREGRGGYSYPTFDLEKSKGAEPAYRVTADQLWEGLLNIYRQVVPTVDGSKTRIAMHGNDPPLYEYLGSPQILCRFADFDRLFKEVPSKNNGMTFCVGTRYESGENVLEGIRYFGKQGKLFHVHFRNVRGTLPSKKGYAEVMVDDGDMRMAKVLQALDEVGYDGVIDYDHPMGIVGDRPVPKQYIAFAVGYMRGLLDSLPQ